MDLNKHIKLKNQYTVHRLCLVKLHPKPLGPHPVIQQFFRTLNSKTMINDRRCHYTSTFYISYRKAYTY